MIARDVFKIGDRVRMTEAAIAQGLDKNRRRESVTTGVVVGFCKGPDLVRVVKNGQVTDSSWSVNFWELEAPAAAEPEEPRK